MTLNNLPGFNCRVGSSQEKFALSSGSIHPDIQAVYAAVREPLRLISSKLGLPLLPVETIPAESDVETWLSYDFASVKEETKAELRAALAGLGVSG